MSTAGPWELLKRLSTGGMGEVFVARPASGASDRLVAVKLMLPHLVEDRVVITRFLDEAKLAARMTHPNVVQIFDVGMTDGRPWLAMELVEGVSLWTLLERCRAHGEQLPLPVVRHIAKGLCDGLAYAHALTGPSGEALDLVHRDVSPSNVLVSAGGVVRLTDFGLAHAVGNWAKTTPGGLGPLKLGYTAPEIGRGKTDQRVDIFSAGVTLYETATLAHPFRRDGASDLQVFEAVLQGQPPKPSSARPAIPIGLEVALMRALKSNPEERPTNVIELRTALLDGEVARPEELGALVHRLCPEELARFFSLDAVPLEAVDVPTVTTIVAPGTVVTTIAALPEVSKPPKESRLTLAFAVLAFVVIGGGLFAIGRQLKGGLPAPSAAIIELADVVDLQPSEPAHEPVVEPTAIDLPPLDVSPHVGWLSIQGESSMPVLLDGKKLESPVRDVEVAAGRHVLTFRGKTRRAFTISEGQHVTVRVPR